MKGFCISLDVSKGSSFYQGFKDFDEPITKSKKIEHKLEGFHIKLFVKYYLEMNVAYIVMKQRDLLVLIKGLIEVMKMSKEK